MKKVTVKEMREISGGSKIQCTFGRCKAKFPNNLAGKSAYGWHHWLMHCGPTHSPQGTYRIVNN